MKKFIYVFNKEAKEKLQKAGFILVKEDERASTYIFAANDSYNFALNDVSFIVSDTLTF